MLSKLRGQLEEMRSKVQFLGLVKKYLQASPPHLLPSLQRPGAHGLRLLNPQAWGRVTGQQAEQTVGTRCPRSCTRSGGAWSPAPSR